MCNVSLINYGAKCVVVCRRTIDDKKTLAVLLEKSSYGTVIMKKLSLFSPSLLTRRFFLYTVSAVK